MDVFADLRQGWIEFRSRPWVSAVAVATLALGIAGSTTMFTMLSAASRMMVPPGIDPARVGRVVWLQYDQDGSRGPLAAEEYAQLKATRVFEQLSASTDQTMVFGGSGGPSTSVGRVSPDYFATFDWKPTAGRLFTSEDSRPGSAPVAIVREGARVRLSGADIGKVVRLGSGSYTIVGILPDRCWFMAPNWPDLWVPLEIGADGVPTARSVTVTARLRSTAPNDIDRVQARIRTIGERLQQTQSAFASAARRLRLVTLQEDAGKRFGFGLVAMLGPAIVVLLIACGNVANLLLARGARRQQEMAVRAALTAISCSRLAPRASSRFATLPHAISKTTIAGPSMATRPKPNRLPASSCRVTRRNRRAAGAKADCVCRRRSPIARTCACTRSTSAGEVLRSRAVTVTERAVGMPSAPISRGTQKSGQFGAMNQQRSGRTPTIV